MQYQTKKFHLSSAQLYHIEAENTIQQGLPNCPKLSQLGVGLNWYKAEFFLPWEHIFHHPLKLATFRNKQLDVKYPFLITTSHVPKAAP